MLSYQKEEPGSPCASGLLGLGLDFPLGADGEQGVVGRGRGE